MHALVVDAPPCHLPSGATRPGSAAKEMVGSSFISKERRALACWGGCVRSVHFFKKLVMFLEAYVLSVQEYCLKIAFSDQLCHS